MCLSVLCACACACACVVLGDLLFFFHEKLLEDDVDDYGGPVEDEGETSDMGQIDGEDPRVREARRYSVFLLYYWLHSYKTASTDAAGGAFFFLCAGSSFRGPKRNLVQSVASSRMCARPSILRTCSSKSDR